MSDAPRTVRAAVGIGAITAVSRLVGFVRVLVVAAVLGATYLGNAFQSANSVSNILFELVAAGALSAVLVPAFVDMMDAGDDEGAEEVAGGVLGVAMAGLGVLAALGMIFSPWLARLLTLGVPDEVAADQRRLVTFLLIFFLPQVVLYAAGTVSTGVLYAKRRFLPTAAAPMANTIVMVAGLLVFRAAAGSDPGLVLPLGQRLMLVFAATGGVIAFVAVLVLACRRTGFHLRPRLTHRDPRVRRVLGQAGWGVVLHSSAGVLLGGAVIAGAAVEGGVIAYQTAWVFFLAPYAVFSQPIHTAILPELVVEARDATLDRFATSVRWAVERIALPILPISVALAALAGPGMRIVSVGAAAKGNGPELLAVALASLAIGLFPYGVFLLLARAYYALGDSRTPGQVAIGVAVVGAVIMAIGAPLTHGTARLAVIGLAHTAAHIGGAAVLGRGLHQRTGHPMFPPVVGLLVVLNLVLGVAMWAGTSALLPADPTRGEDLLASIVAVAAGGAVLVGCMKLLGVKGHLTARVAPPPAIEDVDALITGELE